MSISFLPTLNAILNATSGILIVIGYRFIRRGRIAAHRACMIGAVTSSTLFLISYVVYHVGFKAGVTRFTGTGWVRPSRTMKPTIIRPAMTSRLSRRFCCSSRSTLC